MKLSLSNLCGIFFFAATAVNLFNGVGLASVLSFISGSFFLADQIKNYIKSRPAPIRYPQKGGVRRIAAKFTELRKRPPSPELVELINKIGVENKKSASRRARRNK